MELYCSINNIVYHDNTLSYVKTGAFNNFSFNTLLLQ